MRRTRAAGAGVEWGSPVEELIEMKLSIESTDQVIRIDGVDCRVWRGVDEAGRSYEVYVHRIGAREEVAWAECERELMPMSEPRVVLMGVIPPRRLRQDGEPAKPGVE